MESRLLVDNLRERPIVLYTKVDAQSNKLATIPAAITLILHADTRISLRRSVGYKRSVKESFSVTDLNSSCNGSQVE